MCIPRSIVASLTHDIFIKGCQINFSVEGPKDIEVGSLYPDIPFRSVDECFDDYIREIQEQPADGMGKPNSMVEVLAITAATCAWLDSSFLFLQLSSHDSRVEVFQEVVFPSMG